MNSYSLGIRSSAALWLLLAESAVPSAWAQSGPGCPGHKPLTLTQVLAYIGRMPEEHTVQRIESCRVSFRIDVQTLDRLVSAGASAKVLDTLNELTASRLTLEEAKTEVAELERHIEQSEKAGNADLPYRSRVTFLQQSSYLDLRSIKYLHYDADTQQMAAQLGGEEYWFDNLAPAAAETMVKNWPEVRALQPYTDNELHSRTLVLDNPSISVTGIPRKEKEAQTHVENERQIAGLLSTAQARMASRDYDGAVSSYQSVLTPEPQNPAATAGLAAARVALTWVDPQTKLMWTLKDSDRNLDWEGASQYCQTLHTGAFSDWRLASIDELKGLYDPRSTSVTPPLQSDIFVSENGLSGRYRKGTSWTYHIKGGISLRDPNIWSSSENASEPGGRPVMVTFIDGKDWLRPDNPTFRRALCVRPSVPGAGTATASVPQPAVESQTTPKPGVKHSELSVRVFKEDISKCTAGDATACNQAGYCYARGLGVDQDLYMAQQFYQRSCEMGYRIGCQNVKHLKK